MSGARLAGRVAVVTGAGRGIGAAVARLLAAEGAAVVVNDLGVALDGSDEGDSPADQVVAEITTAGGQAVANGADIGEHAGGAALVECAIDHFGRLDVVVNVAGILRDRMIFNLSEEDWDAVIRVHLKGHFNTIKPAAAYWRRLAEPDAQHRIINYTSSSGLYGAPTQPNYSAAKLGIVGLTYSCANALARYGVTCNAIAPSAVTRMTGTISAERRAAYAPEITAESTAPVVAYLASRDSGWCTGRVIGVRGHRVTLFSNPEPIRQIAGTGPWEIDTLGELMRANFEPAVRAGAALNPNAPK